MASAKDTALALLRDLPDEASWEQIIDAITGRKTTGSGTKSPTLFTIIEQARVRILNLPDNFDGEESKAYLPETFDRVAQFLKQLEETLLRQYQIQMMPPEILPGPKGSIDLHWTRPNFELLINIPENTADPASYYGDDFGHNTTEGTFDLAQPEQGFLYWLKKR